MSKTRKIQIPVIDQDAFHLFDFPNLTGTPERNMLMAILEGAILDFVGNDEKEAQAAQEVLNTEILALKTRIAELETQNGQSAEEIAAQKAELERQQAELALKEKENRSSRHQGVPGSQEGQARQRSGDQQCGGQHP